MCSNYLIRFHHESSLPVTYKLWAHVHECVVYSVDSVRKRLEEEDSCYAILSKLYIYTLCSYGNSLSQQKA